MPDSPFAVICPDHGQVFLTEDEYIEQLTNADERWYCPLCFILAEFDDENYSKHFEDPSND